MHGWRWLLRVMLAVLASGAGRAVVATEPEGELIDRVWAGHPVGFALLIERGRIFVAYYDAERRISVASRPVEGGAWQTVRLPGVRNEGKQRFSNVIGWDSHNALVLALDRDGHVHLSGNLHVDPLVYYRTNRPLDIASFERLDRMTGERETRCTYPHFFKNQAGDLLFSYRDGSSGDASDLINIYDAEKRAWRRHLATPLHEGEGLRSAYALAPQLGPDGRFHVLWMWRDTPDAATNQQLGYARSRDLLAWEDSRGQAIATPITFGQGDIIDPAAPGEGLINTTYALGFDREQRPVALYHRYDGAGNSQLYAARPAGDGWERRALTDWSFRWAFGGNGSLLVDVYLLTPRTERDGSLLVPFTTKVVPGGVLRVDGDTLKTQAVLPAEPPPLPAELMKAGSAHPEMGVRTRVVNDGVTRWVLRWETLPSNRDRPRDGAPPPSELRLFSFTAGQPLID